MDIIKKIKPLKASFGQLSITQQLGFLMILKSPVTPIIPPAASAETSQKQPQALFFQIGDHQEFLNTYQKQAKLQYQKEQLQANLKRKLILADKVKIYLNQYNSPLASYSSQLLELKNWKKIVAL